MMLRLGLLLMLNIGRLPKGRSLARFILWPICLGFVLFASKSRRISKQYLKRALNSQTIRLHHVLKHFFYFGTCLLDRGFFLTTPTKTFALEIIGLDTLKKQLQSSSVILLGSHLGSFEAMRGLALVKNINTSNAQFKVLMNTEQSQAFNQIAKSLCPALEHMIIASEQPHSLLSAAEALQNDISIGMLGDRTYDQERSQQQRFLSQNANFPLTPYWLAILSQRPVLTFFALYVGKNRYRIYIEPLLDAVNETNRKKREYIIQTALQQYVQRLTHYTQQYPYNWFNFYDFWQQ